MATLKEFGKTPIRALSVHGVSRAELGDLNTAAIRSIATENGYSSAIRQYHQWLDAYRLSPREVQTTGMLLEFLDEYRKRASQASVDHMRLALEKCYSVKLGHIESCLPKVVRGRAYHFSEIERILAHLTPRNQLSVLLCADAGLRAHECATLFPRQYGEPSPHRNWRSERFAGRNDYEVFLVKGKGGLVREVAVSRPIADAIGQTRRPEPQTITDRGIHHPDCYFDLASGQALSGSFTDASQKALGWSLGLHGLRHSFAQERLKVLIRTLGSQRALLVLSTELGHFRESIGFTYQRGR
jgi:integrase